MTEPSKVAYAFTIHDLDAFILDAETGGRCIYHVGFLAVDADKFTAIKALGRHALMLSKCGYVSLVQQREDENEFTYIAERTAKVLLNKPDSWSEMAMAA